jgi:hypothetical protein
VAPERGLELRDPRHHEVKRGGLLGELALQIQKIRARNMAGLEGVASGHRDIGDGAAFRLVFEIGGAIEQPKLGLTEDAGELRGANEPVMHCHVAILPKWLGTQSSMKRRRLSGPAL